jgi:Uma2 family endonuclease
MDFALDANKRYTYADYCTWDDDIRCELIDGELYVMSPSPSWRHQGVISKLVYQFQKFVEGTPYYVFPAPFDVRFITGIADNTVVQPDLVVILDKSKLDDKACCVGAPDLVVEILSPSTARRDTVVKSALYQRMGVREFWIVDLERKIVMVHILEAGKYFIGAYTDADTIPVHVLEGCLISLPEVFKDI